MAIPYIPVPVAQFAVYEVVNEWLCILRVLCHMCTADTCTCTCIKQRIQTHGCLPEVDKCIGTAAHGEVVHSGEDVNAMRECALSPHILLEGCL